MPRRPAVAGMFYEADFELLRNQIKESYLHPLGPGKLPEINVKGPRKVLGIVSPHAGYMYSGPIAAHGFYQLAIDGKPDTFIILGPNHTGLGSPIATMIEDYWITPLGKVDIDSELAKEVVKLSNIVDIDPSAHRYEHSIEVQIPFLQYLFGEIKFVPISMMWQTPEAALRIAKAIHEASKKLNRDTVIIASTDLNHYEPHNETVRKDKMAINAILRRDSKELSKILDTYNISMCGPGPVMVLMEYSKLVNHEIEVKLLKHATSGDITGDKSAVVGYASIVFKRR